MDEEKINKYSEKVAGDLLKNAIKMAYLQGYNDAYSEINAKRRSVKGFVDLGLPSGTLIADDFLKFDNNIVYLNYEEAQGYDLIDSSVYEEIKKYCKLRIEKPGYISITGSNDNKIVLPSIGLYKEKEFVYNTQSLYTWLHGGVYPQKPQCAFVASLNYVDNCISCELTKTSYKHPILLIRHI